MVFRFRVPFSAMENKTEMDDIFFTTMMARGSENLYSFVYRSERKFVAYNLSSVFVISVFYTVFV